MSEKAEEEKPEAEAGPEKSGLSGLRRITIAAISVAVLFFIYTVIADRTTPFSGDAAVQAFILRVAPEINGRVEHVGVADNSVVDAGSELFRIDPTPFEIAVAQAEASLTQAGLAVGASTASVEAAQARLDEARANEANIRAQNARVLELVERGVYPRARADDARAAIEAGRAGVETAEAELRRAQEEMGPEGQDNPQIQSALAALERARFDLSRTNVTAPSRGVVTNLQLAGGQMVVTGQPAMTFISGEDVWLLASMRENNIGVLEPGQHAEIVLDVLPGQIFNASVQSVGWGIADSNVDPSTGLPTSVAASGWLTDPQRFPVHFVFDSERVPTGARYGSKAAVIVYATGNPVMDAIAWLRIRLIALLTYIS